MFQRRPKKFHGVSQVILRRFNGFQGVSNGFHVVVGGSQRTFKSLKVFQDASGRFFFGDFRGF